MDHAVVENEKQPTKINEAPNDALTDAKGESSQPPDTTTLQGTIANEANPNLQPR